MGSFGKSARINLLEPAFVEYGHPDLLKIDEYLKDFGLHAIDPPTASSEKVFYRGYGRQPVIYIASKNQEPKYLGVYFEVQSWADLENAEKLQGATSNIRWLEQPGGGYSVSLRDPSGLPFHVVYGMEKLPFNPPKRDILLSNYPAASDEDTTAKPRRGKFQRLSQGIVPVHKLGHVGHRTHLLEETESFYTTHFNFKPSDFLTAPDGTTFIIFLHIDLGKKYSDHHSFFLARDSASGPHHAAFEVDGIDNQFIAHDQLLKRGYKSYWGVGRHTEGSQVFDYWYDIDGFILEHYTDGDLVNQDTRVGTMSIQRDRNNNWGPEFDTSNLLLKDMLSES